MVYKGFAYQHLSSPFSFFLTYFPLLVTPRQTSFLLLLSHPYLPNLPPPLTTKMQAIGKAIGKLFEGRFQPRISKKYRQRRLRQDTCPGELPLRTETFPVQLPPRPATSHMQLPLRLAVQFGHLFMIATFLSLTIPRLIMPGGPHYLYTAIGVFIVSHLMNMASSFLTFLVCRVSWSSCS